MQVKREGQQLETEAKTFYFWTFGGEGLLHVIIPVYSDLTL